MYGQTDIEAGFLRSTLRSPPKKCHNLVIKISLMTGNYHQAASDVTHMLVKALLKALHHLSSADVDVIPGFP